MTNSNLNNKERALVHGTTFTANSVKYGDLYMGEAKGSQEILMKEYKTVNPRYEIIKLCVPNRT